MGTQWGGVQVPRPSTRSRKCPLPFLHRRGQAKHLLLRRRSFVIVDSPGALGLPGVAPGRALGVSLSLAQRAS